MFSPSFVKIIKEGKCKGDFTLFGKIIKEGNATTKKVSFSISCKGVMVFNFSKYEELCLTHTHTETRFDISLKAYVVSKGHRDE